MEAVLASLRADNIDDTFDKLRFFFPENLLLAALDLIDRDSVIKIHRYLLGFSSFVLLGPTFFSFLYLPRFCVLGPLVRVASHV
ncbi:hypothetical protein A0H81_09069 [Grifola frondosa]|uniref:Uncharacterized protein n=1 Tax=Grifola frondosa TaxID=5627 RepID=A0A1C7M1K7_GRIFR|nr:hypothetical protein A0H81_09069 [Grifola frondosa]